ncbi:MAG: response regulator [Chloroflexi bacterium]|nr:response regulator [Chloroflexota bacterium]
MEQPSTILIVDDDRVTRQILRGLLEPEGHVIATAGDGDSALERARELMPDLVLLDVLMPGLDGYEVCRRLRADAQLAEVPIIMLTALDDRASRLIGMEAGADDFVSKPFDRVELLTRLRSITRLNRFRRLLQERSQLQRAEREVLRRVRELELLNETITRTAATLDVREVFQLGCDALARAFAPALACGLQLDPAEARLSLVASAESSETGRALRMPRAIPEAGLSVGELSYGARLLGSQSPFAVAEPAFALRFAAVDPVPLETETPTSLVLPILTRDQLGGLLELRVAQRAGFDDLDLGLAESIATAVAKALESAQLYGRLQRHAEELEATVASRTRELAAERDRIRAILEALGEAAFVTDPTGRIEYVNPAAVAMTGYGRDEVAGLDFAHWHPDRRIERFFAEFGDGAGSCEGWSGELVARRKDGTYFDAVLTLAPLLAPDSGRQTIGFVGVQRDVTPLKEAERLKERFVSNVSHELRTPLSVITLLSGNLDALGDRIDPAKRRSMVRDIRRQAQVLDELIRDVLEISSIDSGRITPDLQPLDLAPLMLDEAQRLQPLAERNQQTLDADGPESLIVEGDPQQLRRVVRNLVNNAIKYTPEGGQVRCEWRFIEVAEAPPPDWPGGAALDGGRWAAVRICDTGIGIEADDLDRVFERFYRVNNQGSVPGTGLGLSITRELIALHSGHIAVASTPGRGSVFAFYLPLPREGKPREP